MHMHARMCARVCCMCACGEGRQCRQRARDTALHPQGPVCGPGVVTGVPAGQGRHSRYILRGAAQPVQGRGPGTPWPQLYLLGLCATSDLSRTGPAASWAITSSPVWPAPRTQRLGQGYFSPLPLCGTTNRPVLRAPIPAQLASPTPGGSCRTCVCLQPQAVTVAVFLVPRPQGQALAG